MKKHIFCIPLILLIGLQTISSKSHSKEQLPILKGPYLGQKTPGSTAEKFAPGIVSTELYELFNAFTPDMTEFYFVRYDKQDKPSMHLFKSHDNQWSHSVVGPRVGEPFISPDGKTMHLGRRYMERNDASWSEIKPLGSFFEKVPIMRLTASSKGTYVFDEMGGDNGNGIIRYSRLKDGKRQQPIRFSKAINTGTANAHPFIAPDESYLIWDGRRDSGFGNSDLYVSFKQQDGTWGKAHNLGEKINSDASEIYASVTPDGKYLFFSRKVSAENMDLYWVDTQIIEHLRLKDKAS